MAGHDVEKAAAASATSAPPEPRMMDSEAIAREYSPSHQSGTDVDDAANSHPEEKCDVIWVTFEEGGK